MQPNRGEREIHHLRKEIKSLNKQFKRTPAYEREGIKELIIGEKGEGEQEHRPFQIHQTTAWVNQNAGD